VTQPTARSCPANAQRAFSKLTAAVAAAAGALLPPCVVVQDPGLAYQLGMQAGVAAALKAASVSGSPAKQQPPQRDNSSVSLLTKTCILTVSSLSASTAQPQHLAHLTVSAKFHCCRAPPAAPGARMATAPRALPAARAAPGAAVDRLRRQRGTHAAETLLAFSGRGMQRHCHQPRPPAVPCMQQCHGNEPPPLRQRGQPQRCGV
jgi:hypothetical protein